jgi:hypothetical protein
MVMVEISLQLGQLMRLLKGMMKHIKDILH